MADPTEDFTLLLHAVHRGDDGAAARLMELVYGQLRSLAGAKLAREREAGTLQPTALVHEVWLRLGGDHQPAWNSRGHFFGAAAEAMRRILIERARSRRAMRHGGDQRRVAFDEAGELRADEEDDRLLAVDEALHRLAVTDPSAAELVKLHFFVGLSMRDSATALNISESTAWRWWAFARAWLYRELHAE